MESFFRSSDFHVGEFLGESAKLAAVYGYPKADTENGKRVPGLLQIHGGGQYADSKACLANAKRGYATLSIAWAGRISSPSYRVSPREVKLFWEGAIEGPCLSRDNRLGQSRWLSCTGDAIRATRFPVWSRQVGHWTVSSRPATAVGSLLPLPRGVDLHFSSNNRKWIPIDWASMDTQWVEN